MGPNPACYDRLHLYRLFVIVLYPLMKKVSRTFLCFRNSVLLRSFWLRIHRIMRRWASRTTLDRASSISTKRNLSVQHIRQQPGSGTHNPFSWYR